MANEVEIKWLTDPEEDDYPAAASYLSLLYDEHAVGIPEERERDSGMNPNANPG